MELHPKLYTQISPKTVYLGLLDQSFKILQTSLIALVALWCFSSNEGSIHTIGLLSILILAVQVLNLIMRGPTARSWRYEVEENHIDLQWGVFLNRRCVIPLYAIQHVDITQNIFERFFKVVSIKIVTSATTHTIPGLCISTASALRKTLFSGETAQ